MALITRVSRLFRADFHAVLDRIEEPDVLLRQAVREMEEELAREQQRIQVLSYELGQLTARTSDVDHSLSEIEEELNVCFEAKKNDLARTLIRRKLEAQRLRKFLLRKREGLEDTLAGLKARLDEHRAHLHNLRQKAELLAEDREAHQAEDPWGLADSTPSVSIRDEDVEVAFLREQRKRGQS
jgi:phage shock protein A